MLTKTCTECQATLPTSEFSKNKNGRINLCPRCLSATRLPWRKNIRTAKPGYLYILHAAGDMYKIGNTKHSAIARHEQIQASSPIPVYLIYSRYFTDCALVENNIHCMVKDYHSHAEWFCLPYGVFLEILGVLKKDEANEQST